MNHIKSFEDLNSINEGKYSIPTEQLDRMDWLDKSKAKNALNLANKEPQVGWWVNLSSEYGDVWHKVSYISIDEERVGSSMMKYWEHRRLNGADKKTTQESDITFLHNARDIQPTLPDKARIIVDENGQR